MKMSPRSNKGFTLVEIMIVVVIIGLLAAMALPAFQKVRRASMGKAMVNDARQIGAAGQQIALEYPAAAANGQVLAITVGADGALTSTALTNGGQTIPLNIITQYVTKISRGTNIGALNYTFGGSTPLVPATSVAFTLTNPQVAPTDAIATSTFAANQVTTVNSPVSFDEEGKAL